MLQTAQKTITPFEQAIFSVYLRHFSIIIPRTIHMFGFLKNTFQSIYSQFTSKVHALFSRNTIDQATLDELEQILLKADTGVATTRTILTNLTEKYKRGDLQKGDDLKTALEEELLQLLGAQTTTESGPVFLLVGVNGSGKTTFAGKLAHRYVQDGKKVLLVAADTFRAAARQQLESWAQKTGASIITGSENQDPASVVFAGCEKFKHENFDILIIDTAGRLQTKVNLMNELAKIKRIITRQLPEQNVTTLLTVDAMLGQNSFQQAKLFNECTHIDGIVLTKLDGTGKGGIVFAIKQELAIPIAFISSGEQAEHCAPFNANEYIAQLLHE